MNKDSLPQSQMPGEDPGDAPKSAERSRRNLFRTGVLLAPVILTLRAKPAWATGPSGTGYGTSRC